MADGTGAFTFLKSACPCCQECVSLLPSVALRLGASLSGCRDEVRVGVDVRVEGPGDVLKVV